MVGLFLLKMERLSCKITLQEPDAVFGLPVEPHGVKKLGQITQSLGEGKRAKDHGAVKIGEKVGLPVLKEIPAMKIPMEQPRLMEGLHALRENRDCRPCPDASGIDDRSSRADGL